MKQSNGPDAGRPYRVVNISPVRQIVVTFLDLSSWGHTIFAFVEADVTAARRCLSEYEVRTGEGLSFTGYLIYCLAQAVDADKSVQAYRQGRKKLLLFDDVDVGMMIEHRFDQQDGEGQPARDNRAPTGHVIRRANQKTFLEIHREIRALQSRPPQSKGMPSWLRFVQRAPGAAQKLLVALVGAGMRRDPAGKWVAMAGTVGVTAVGMFGSGGGWGLGPPDHHTVSMVVGGITCRPTFVGDRIEPHEYLCLTLGFNHDVVDGAPAARFVKRLTALIESAYGLEIGDRASLERRIHA